MRHNLQGQANRLSQATKSVTWLIASSDETWFDCCASVKIVA
jgi:hypothetical protein